MFQVRGPLVSWQPLSTAPVVQEHPSTGYQRQVWGGGGVRLPISVLTCVFYYLVASLVRLHSTVWKLPVWILSMVMCPIHPTYLKCKATQLFVAPFGT